MEEQTMERLVLAGLTTAALALSLGAAAPAGAQTAPTKPAAASAAPTAGAAPAPAVQTVEPEALEALRRMSTYLQTLNAFEIRTQTTFDLVTRDGQTVQLDGGAVYKVRRPNNFAIRVTSNRKSRSFLYDGKQITVYAPNLSYYATTSAPATIRETLDLMANKYQIRLPLEDLFRWSDPADKRAEDLKSGFHAGTAIIDGATTDQYVFREGTIDWQIWIEQGARPLPRKVVITDRIDPANPAYIAKLSWNLSPTLSDQDFAFRPGKDDKLIQLADVAR
jgi:hypothetical protein